MNHGLENVIVDGGRPTADAEGFTVGIAPVYSLTTDPENSQILYAGIVDNGLYKSINGGGNWFPIQTPDNVANITALAMSGRTLYIGTAGTGVFRLDNMWDADDKAYFHFKTGKLVLPLIDLGESNGLSLTMVLVDPVNLIFEVDSFAAADVEMGAMGRFDAAGGHLYLPQLQVGDDVYSVVMQLQDELANTPRLVISQANFLLKNQ
ncbi:MAG: hypothetical protein AAF512_03565 [Pseudomonadota bacterium]